MNSAKLVETIPTVGNDGERYTVLIFQERIRTNAMDGPDWIDGMKEMHLQGGGRVTPTDDADSFEIVQTGVILRRV